MYCLTLNLSSAEWVKIREAASKQWPGETLSHSEVLRRYVLIGIGTLKNVSPQDAKRLAHELQCSMPVGDTRLKS